MSICSSDIQEYAGTLVLQIRESARGGLGEVARKGEVIVTAGRRRAREEGVPRKEDAHLLDARDLS